MPVSDNLLSSLMGFITPDLIRRSAEAVGLTPEKTQIGLKVVIPTLIAGIVRKGSTIEGARNLMSRIQTDNYLKTPPEHFINQLHSRTYEDFLGMGSRSLNGIFGSNLNAITETIHTYTSIPTEIIHKLFNLMTPLALSVLGSKIKHQGLEASSLAGFLGQQKSIVQSALPSGLVNLFQNAGINTETDAETPTSEHRPSESVREKIPPSNYVRESPQKGSNWLPAALAILIALGGFWMIRDRRHVPPPPAHFGDIGQEAGKLGSRPEDAGRNLKDAAQKSARDLEGPGKRVLRSNAQDPVTAFLESGSSDTPKRISLRELHFKSGSAELVQNADRLLDEIADALKAHPSAVVRLESYTDSVGNYQRNLTLSQQRAETVKRELIRRGVDATRLKAVGKGSSNPVASNQTQDGRELNRRTEVVIVRR